MATPVLVDLNNDQKSQELVIPVSYFFDEEDYRFVQLNTVLSHFYSWLFLVFYYMYIIVQPYATLICQ